MSKLNAECCSTLPAGRFAFSDCALHLPGRQINWQAVVEGTKDGQIVPGTTHNQFHLRIAINPGERLTQAAKTMRKSFKLPFWLSGTDRGRPPFNPGRKPVIALGSVADRRNFAIAHAAVIRLLMPRNFGDGILRHSCHKYGSLITRAPYVRITENSGPSICIALACLSFWASVLSRLPSCCAVGKPTRARRAHGGGDICRPDMRCGAGLSLPDCPGAAHGRA